MGGCRSSRLRSYGCSSWIKADRGFTSTIFFCRHRSASHEWELCIMTGLFSLHPGCNSQRTTNERTNNKADFFTSAFSMLRKMRLLPHSSCVCSPVSSMKTWFLLLASTWGKSQKETSQSRFVAILVPPEAWIVTFENSTNMVGGVVRAWRSTIFWRFEEMQQCVWFNRQFNDH